MLTHHALPRLAARLPGFFSGRRLHRMALHASHRGHSQLANRLFEAAITRYREDLRVESLARLRVHQLMIRARAEGGADDRAELALEIERRLVCLDTIESIEPPFAGVEARSMLANWQSESPEVPRRQRQAA